MQLSAAHSHLIHHLSDIEFAVGDICIHEKFGKGVVTSLEGDGIIVVNFDSHGEKTLLGNHKMISKGNK